MEEHIFLDWPSTLLAIFLSGAEPAAPLGALFYFALFICVLFACYHSRATHSSRREVARGVENADSAGTLPSVDPSPAANGLGRGSRGESSGPGLTARSPSTVASLPACSRVHSADPARLPGAAMVARSLLMGGHKIYLFAIPFPRPPPPPRHGPEHCRLCSPRCCWSRLGFSALC